MSLVGGGSGTSDSDTEGAAGADVESDGVAEGKGPVGGAPDSAGDSCTPAVCAGLETVGRCSGI